MIEGLGVELMSILMLAALIIVLMFGHPIAFVFGGVGLIFGYLLRGPSVFYMFTSQAMGTMDSGILVAIVMFILMANLLVKSGIAEDLFEAIRYLMGPLRGGVAVAVIVVCMILAACTGIVGAAVVSMGLAALPVMMKYGYEKRLAAGTICAGGTLGIMLPPSVMLIALADLTGLSAGKLLAGGVFPGFLLGGLYILYIVIRCRLRPELGPALSLEERAAVPVNARLKLAVKSILAPGLLILIVLGSIFTGVATAREASGVGAFLSFVIVLIYRRFSWRMLREALQSTAKSVAMVMFIIVATNCYTAVFLDFGGGKVIMEYMVASGLGKWGAFFVMMLFIFILGMPIEWVGIIYLVVPIFLPIVIKFGIDPLWFTICVAVNMQNAFISPPAGASMFYLLGVSKGTLTTADVFRGVMPFVILQLIGLGVCIAFPSAVLFLPNLIK
ncbi:MAG: C4-dicarboxylate ABC transporter [Deltaproteobacteria bacterium RBG_16_49_23]|nr:MAG: C4-dicarboxylate ABC transporter [Deltaproteobacteria bacterium RBG_16_49_23]